MILLCEGLWSSLLGVQVQVSEPVTALSLLDWHQQFRTEDLVLDQSLLQLVGPCRPLDESPEVLLYLLLVSVLHLNEAISRSKEFYLTSVMRHRHS